MCTYGLRKTRTAPGGCCGGVTVGDQTKRAETSSATSRMFLAVQMALVVVWERVESVLSKAGRRAWVVRNAVTCPSLRRRELDFTLLR